MGSNHKITNVYANKEIIRQLMALIAFPANLDAKNVLTLTNVINVEVDIWLLRMAKNVSIIAL